MPLVVFEDAGFVNLLPLVYGRAVFDLRCGSDSLLDKIETACEHPADGLVVRDTIAGAMRERQPRGVNTPPEEDDQVWINGRLIVRRMFDLPPNTAVWRGDVLLAARINAKTARRLAGAVFDSAACRTVLDGIRSAQIDPADALLIDYPWQLIHANEAEIVRQFGLVSCDIVGEVSPGAHLVNASAMHIGRGSRVKPGAVLDTEPGPIYVGEDVTISPNVTITGPCYIGDGCLIQPCASIRGGTSIGPRCKVGGEVEGSLFQGFANKQHDGFLGHSFVGEWVNLGADTVTSDLKNTYGPIRVPINGRLVDSGEMFVGSIIGDHAKTGIQSTLPTGCVIGYAANVFLSRTPPKFVPSFSWLTDDGREWNDPARALAVARKVVARRGRRLSPEEADLFLSIAKEARRHEADPAAGGGV
ncbi:MAG: putative sugar nucleotidyl transferase [Phycisphaerae bacterium]